MAEYIPIFKPGQAVTLSASAAITGGQVLAVSGSGTVAPTAAASTAVVGVAGFDAAINDKVTVYSNGVQNCTTTGAVTAGDMVVSAAAGTVATAGATPAANTLLGIALTTAVAGAKVRVQFNR